MLKKKNCLSCYFCVKAFCSPDDGQVKKLALFPDARNAFMRGDFSSVRQVDVISEYLECHKGQWSEALNGVDVASLRKSLGRKKCGFFYPHHKGEGKFLDGVDRELESHRVSLALKTASWSLFIAALSFLVAFSDKVEKLLAHVPF